MLVMFRVTPVLIVPTLVVRMVMVMLLMLVRMVMVMLVVLVRMVMVWTVTWLAEGRCRPGSLGRLPSVSLTGSNHQQEAHNG